MDMCPFCGGAPRGFANGPFEELTDANKHLPFSDRCASAFIECKSCGARTDEYKTYTEAENAWCKRVDFHEKGLYPRIVKAILKSMDQSQDVENINLAEFDFDHPARLYATAALTAIKGK